MTMKTTMEAHQADMPSAATLMMYNDPIELALSRIPPLWPLSRFVAVNPFVGLSKLDFQTAALLLHKTTGTLLALTPLFYRERFQSGIITREDLKNALKQAGGKTIHSEDHLSELISALECESWEMPESPFYKLPSTLLDAAHGTRWGSFISEEISKWCSAYFDEGQALWSFPWKGMQLFAAWKEAASLDRNPEISGIARWRSLLSGLSDNPIQVIEDVAINLRIPEEHAADIFHGLLLSIGGWGGHLQFLAHEKQLRGEGGGALKDLLAIRIVYELALESSFKDDPALESFFAANQIAPQDSLVAPLVWQRAHECAMQRVLFSKLSLNFRDVKITKNYPPSFQAVFCIDVRSEIYRRSLESVAPEVQTMGFAGFFGFPIEAVSAGETRGTPQCPVLLNPVSRVFESSSKENLRHIALRKRVKSAWKSFKSSAVSSFVFVEIAGLGFLAKILRSLFRWPHKTKRSGCASHLDVDSIPIETQIAMAGGVLRHLGFSKEGLARIVLLCGHGSSTENNPYGSSLDCGACGGHTGEANARTAAAILNNPCVRSGLAARGILVPEQTWFLAALHNTTTDEVMLLDKEFAASSHQKEIATLVNYLAQAGDLARRERAPLLGLSPSDPCLKKLIEDRSRDWSQVRPEWGLAGNYAFVAADRKRTREIDLGGRVFLNDYCYCADLDESTLELLLSAPVVVASWINLQYYASTVDNQRFGSGDKTIHNVAGLLGVLEGNGGDIRTGLPFQSVHDGKDWRHEPLRLHVCVEAPKEAIDRILKKHPSVAELIANQWIHLFSMSQSTEGSLLFEKSNGLGVWRSEPVQGELQSIVPQSLPRGVA